MESVVLWVVVGFLALVVAVLYQLVRQHGRLLLRLDVLERRLSVVEAQDEEYVTQGLAVGTEFSPFRFPDLTGTEVSLDEFRGKRLVLVNWSPGCGFCDL